MDYGLINIDDNTYEDLPIRFETIDEDFGVRSSSRKLLKGKRLVTVESSSDIGDYTHLRKVKRQAWRAVWDGSETVVSFDLKNKLSSLYDTQKGFFIQLDDEMSRCYARLIVANSGFDKGENYKAYFTPTHPIFPYDYSVGDTISWGATGDMIVDGKYWEGGYTVDQESGLVLINPNGYKFTNSTRVSFRYTWRAYVRILSLELAPVDINQYVYSGNVVFEQLAFPG